MVLVDYFSLKFTLAPLDSCYYTFRSEWVWSHSYLRAGTHPQNGILQKGQKPSQGSSQGGPGPGTTASEPASVFPATISATPAAAKQLFNDNSIIPQPSTATTISVLPRSLWQPRKRCEPGWTTTVSLRRAATFIPSWTAYKPGTASDVSWPLSAIHGSSSTTTECHLPSTTTTTINRSAAAATRSRVSGASGISRCSCSSASAELQWSRSAPAARGRVHAPGAWTWSDTEFFSRSDV